MSDPTSAAEHARLAGHELRSEGAALKWEIGGNRRYLKRVQPQGVGGAGRAACSCGKTSPVLASGSQRKQWHRDHKQEMRDV